MDNVLHFPTSKPLDPLLGPFSYNAVIVEGCKIPLLTGIRDDEGNVSIIVDERFSVTFPPDLAYQAAWLLAQAIAVASGYSHFGAETKDMPFASRCAALGEDK